MLAKTPSFNKFNMQYGKYEIKMEKGGGQSEERVFRSLIWFIQIAERKQNQQGTRHSSMV